MRGMGSSGAGGAVEWERTDGPAMSVLELNLELELEAEADLEAAGRTVRRAGASAGAGAGAMRGRARDVRASARTGCVGRIVGG
jgi:hypothetical protein